MGVSLPLTLLPLCLCRLRSVKMEQRKLNDQANTLVDLAKVSDDDGVAFAGTPLLGRGLPVLTPHVFPH